ncbi:MAG TPA: helix-turn-helix domain-containing protein [Syntrophales bacterium]|nr:helix-turn-helix domain-containing protein [Syntrophales bacterium]
MTEQITPQNHGQTFPLTTKRYYRVDEVARYFSVSDRTIYRLIDMGDLKAIRLRNCLRIPAEEVLALEERRIVDLFK